MSFRICPDLVRKNAIGILVRSLFIFRSLLCYGYFTALLILIHEHGISLHLFVSFINVLQSRTCMCVFSARIHDRQSCAWQTGALTVDNPALKELHSFLSLSCCFALASANMMTLVFQILKCIETLLVFIC